MTAFLEKANEEFDQRYVEGTFHELWAFARFRRLPFHKGQDHYAVANGSDH